MKKQQKSYSRLVGIQSGQRDKECVSQNSRKAAKFLSMRTRTCSIVRFQDVAKLINVMPGNGQGE